MPSKINIYFSHNAVYFEMRWPAQSSRGFIHLQINYNFQVFYGEIFKKTFMLESIIALLWAVMFWQYVSLNPWRIYWHLLIWLLQSFCPWPKYLLEYKNLMIKDILFWVNNFPYVVLVDLLYLAEVNVYTF